FPQTDLVGKSVFGDNIGHGAQTKSCLWTSVAGCYTVFAWRLTQVATVLDELLTERFAGVVMCDGAQMYWSVGNVQWCWAHLQRDFQALADRAVLRDTL